MIVLAIPQITLVDQIKSFRKINRKLLCSQSLRMYEFIHPQIDGYHGRSLDSIVCKINDKGTIPYGETYETKVRDKTLTYKCQCTEREKYPVLQGVK